MSDPGSQPLRLVVIGGGGGVSQVLLGARAHFADLVGVIAVTDTGRSTGIARALATMPAPGDLRNTLAALAGDPDSLLARLLQHRFSSPALPLFDGMAFGNLLIAALTQLTGDFAQAVETVNQMLACTARILPVSTVNTQLCAEREDGSIAADELAVRALHQAPIRRLYLNPPAAPATPQVLKAISEADVVALGPGSFFTSLLATLLFDGIVASLRQTKASVVYICNSTTQPGQTDGLTIGDHVRRLVDLLGSGTLDIALISSSAQVSPEVVAQYAADGLHLLRPSAADLDTIVELGVTPQVSELTEQITAKRSHWNKQDTIRYDSALMGAALHALAVKRR